MDKRPWWDAISFDGDERRQKSKNNIFEILEY